MRKGDQLGGRYALLGELGHGASAVVWLARDAVDGELVAVKLMHPHLMTDATAVARLRRELHAAQRVGHPAILAARELVEADGRIGLVMPYFEGQPLSDHVELQGSWTSDAVFALAVRLADALGAAHRAGVVHRDLSPNNVLVDASGVAALSDFGLARVDGRHTASATGMVGTFGFAAPEVVMGQVAGPRADLYGLGAVLYLAATGTAPFAAPTPVATLTRQAEGSWARLADVRPDLAPPLAALVDALLHPDPAARPGSAREVLDVLRGDLPPPVAVPVGLELVLPEGPFEVRVVERPADAGRRRRLRSLRRDGAVGAWVGTVVSGAWEILRREVFGKEARPDDPEAALTRAVAAAVGLPEDALVPSPAVLDERFRLVDGVSAELAERLAHEARVAGFEAEIVEAVPSRGWVGPVLAFLGMLVVAASLVAVGDVDSLFFGVLAAFLVVVVTLSSRTPPPKLPLAYRSDLRAHLTPAWRDRVGRARRPKVAPAPGGEAAAEAEAPEPEDPLLERTRRRLRDLGAVLEASSLAPLAVSELRRTLSALDEEATRLGALRESLREALHELSPEEAAAIQRARQRLIRLQTRQAGGFAVDEALMQRLRRQIGSVERAQARDDELEARMVALDARMVEIGDAAAEVRAKLAVAVTDSASRGLIAALREEAGRARRAREEVAALR